MDKSTVDYLRAKEDRGDAQVCHRRDGQWTRQVERQLPCGGGEAPGLAVSGPAFAVLGNHLPEISPARLQAGDWLGERLWPPERQQEDDRQEKQQRQQDPKGSPLLRPPEPEHHEHQTDDQEDEQQEEKRRQIEGARRWNRPALLIGQGRSRDPDAQEIAAGIAVRIRRLPPAEILRLADGGLVVFRV